MVLALADEGVAIGAFYIPFILLGFCLSNLEEFALVGVEPTYSTMQGY